MKPTSVLVGLALSFGSAVSAKEWPQIRSEEARTLRATGDNMTLAFVPLISLIANFLPRFFNRYGTAASTPVQQARFHSREETEYSICDKAEHEGRTWLNPDNDAQYYACFINQYCIKTKQEPCLELRKMKCDSLLVFNLKQQQCLPKEPNNKAKIIRFKKHRL